MKENQSPPPSPFARPSRGGRAGLAALLLAVAVSVCACTVLTYSGPNGERFARSSLGSSVGIDSLEVEADTNGIRRVRMEGYRNDSNQALTTVTEAAVRAALQAR